MPQFTHGNVTIEVDEHGFMAQPGSWNDDVARALATTEGIAEMTEEHWRIVRYLRDYWLQFTHGDVTIEVDEHGFMAQPEAWNDEVAQALATTEGIAEMTEEHWRIVRYLRDYWLQFGIAPMVRKLCKETGFQLKHVYELFPSGPANGACKVAGLPKPTGCV